MKYRLAAFISDNQYNKELGVWRSDSTVYDTFDQAYMAREVLCDQIDINIKVKVFTELEWRAIPSGYKHADERKWTDNHPVHVIRHSAGVKNSLRYRPYDDYNDGTRWYPPITIKIGGDNKRSYKGYWEHDSVEREVKPEPVVNAVEFSPHKAVALDIGAMLKQLDL